VSQRYASTVALDTVDLRVTPGERVALVGPSGAGKSTLLNLINATLRPTEGTVSVFDNDPALLDRRALRALRRRIATMHQGLLLAGELRVIHNVNAGRLGDWSPSRALWSLVRPQGADDARLALDRFGLGDSLWRRTDQLSGGERQRVALARLVVARPDLILADEPTASLDPTRADDVMRLLAGLATETTTVIASVHAFDLARQHFDRLVGLRHGRLQFDLPAGDVTDGDGDALYDIAQPPS
jgi:phosphonate transport system ATP-binding protein